MMVARRRRSRGQSLVEAALVLPILILVTLGGADLAQAYRYASDIAGASRAGMRSGVQGDAYDIGDAIRSEPNVQGVIQDSSSVWGPTYTGGSAANCSGVGTGTCGDTSGCPSSVFTGTRLACFAIRACTLSSANQCTSYQSWGTRPEPGQNNSGLAVVVVYKYTPFTPLIATFAGVGGSFYLTSSTVGLCLYC